MRELFLEFYTSDTNLLNQIKSNYLDAEIVTKAELRKLSIFKTIKLLRKEKYKKVYIICGNLMEDRNVFVFKLMLLFSRTKKCYLVDADGNELRIYRLKVMMVDLWVVFYKILISLLFAVRTYLTFWLLQKKNREMKNENSIYIQYR